MERSRKLKSTCCKNVPRDRTTFENISYNLTLRTAIANSLYWLLGANVTLSFYNLVSLFLNMPLRLEIICTAHYRNYMPLHCFL